jgi:DNA polymerase III epsilon subunit-like protein
VKNLIFVDCEATGPCPGKGELTEFGAVEFSGRATFHGVLFESRPSQQNPALSERTGEAFDPVKVFGEFEAWLLSVTKGRYIFVSDNPAFDFQWINYGFHHALGRNPFGHSARRISDFYAGLVGDFGNTLAWKRFRVTPHDHNPVNDAMGNVEAFERLLNGDR